jgi:hypothetical protein
MILNRGHSSLSKLRQLTPHRCGIGNRISAVCDVAAVPSKITATSFRSKQVCVKNTKPPKLRAWGPTTGGAASAVLDVRRETQRSRATMVHDHFTIEQPLRNSTLGSALNPFECQKQNPRTIGDLKIWTEPRPDGSEDIRASRGLAPLPKGLIDARCPHCGTFGSLTGALITPTADENDPNIACCACGYWRD